MNKLQKLQWLDPKIFNDLTGLQNQALQIKIENEQDAGRATEFLKSVKMRTKRLEEMRLAETKPLRDEATKINNNFKLLKEFVETIDTGVTQMVLDFNKQELKRRQAEADEKAKIENDRLEKIRLDNIKKLEEEAEKKENEAETKEDLKEVEEIKERIEVVEDFRPQVEVKVEKAEKIKTDKAQQITRKTWVAEVEKLSKVPRDYMIADMKTINTAMRNGVRDIPGVKIYQKETLIIK